MLLSFDVAVGNRKVLIVQADLQLRKILSRYDCAATATNGYMIKIPTFLPAWDLCLVIKWILGTYKSRYQFSL